MKRLFNTFIVSTALCFVLAGCADNGTSNGGNNNNSNSGTQQDNTHGNNNSNNNNNNNNNNNGNNNNNNGQTTCKPRCNGNEIITCDGNKEVKEKCSDYAKSSVCKMEGNEPMCTFDCATLKDKSEYILYCDSGKEHFLFCNNDKIAQNAIWCTEITMEEQRKESIVFIAKEVCDAKTPEEIRGELCGRRQGKCSADASFCQLPDCGNINERGVCQDNVMKYCANDPESNGFKGLISANCGTVDGGFCRELAPEVGVVCDLGCVPGDKEYTEYGTCTNEGKNIKLCVQDGNSERLVKQDVTCKANEKCTYDLYNGATCTAK